MSHYDMLAMQNNPRSQTAPVVAQHVMSSYDSLATQNNPRNHNQSSLYEDSMERVRVHFKAFDWYLDHGTPEDIERELKKSVFSSIKEYKDHLRKLTEDVSEAQRKENQNV